MLNYKRPSHIQSRTIHKIMAGRHGVYRRRRQNIKRVYYGIATMLNDMMVLYVAKYVLYVCAIYLEW